MTDVPEYSTPRDTDGEGFALPDTAESVQAGGETPEAFLARHGIELHDDPDIRADQLANPTDWVIPDWQVGQDGVPPQSTVEARVTGDGIYVTIFIPSGSIALDEPDVAPLPPVPDPAPPVA